MTPIQVLDSVKLLTSYQEVLTFEQTLASLGGAAKAQDLPDLLRVFDDSTQQHEVMWGLVHFIETFFSSEELLRAIAIALPEMLVRAPEWVDTLNFRLLNDDTARGMYKRLLGELDAQSAACLRQGLQRISSEPPPIGPRVLEVLS